MFFDVAVLLQVFATKPTAFGHIFQAPVMQGKLLFMVAVLLLVIAQQALQLAAFSSLPCVENDPNASRRTSQQHNRFIDTQ